MRSNYKKLGQYIKEIDVRNSDNKIIYLRGISSVYKNLIKSKANIIGTDMSKYKIVNTGQFAFNPNTARMGDKIPVALNFGEPCIVSQIYPVFEIIDETKLLPEYLMMWFRRAEFDRYARFKSHGSAREIFDWNEMCDIDLPVPDITKQQEIIDEYNTIKNRISLNNSLIGKLEETAQAVYREWFVDGVDMENLPSGWKIGKLSDIAIIVMGQSPEGETYNKNREGMIFYQGRTDFGYRFPDITTYTTKPKKKAMQNDILISVRAPVGDLNVAIENCAIGRGLGAIRSKIKCNSHLFYTLQNLKRHFDISDGEGTIFGSINKDDLHNMEVIYSEDEIIKFEKIISPIDQVIKNYSIQNKRLGELRNLILSKMASEE